MKTALYPLSLLTLLLTAATAAQAASVPSATTPIVTKCWVRSLPGSGAGYFRLENPSDQTYTLTGISSGDYGMVMMHQSKNVGGVMRMDDAENLPLPAHGQLEFAPSSYHVMLMDAKSAPAIGSKLKLSLQLLDSAKKSLTLTAECEVQGPDGAGLK